MTAEFLVPVNGCFVRNREDSQKIGIVLELRRNDNGQVIWIEGRSKPAASGLYTRTMLVNITQRVLMSRPRRHLSSRWSSGTSRMGSRSPHRRLVAVPAPRPVLRLRVARA